MMYINTHTNTHTYINIHICTHTYFALYVSISWFSD